MLKFFLWFRYLSRKRIVFLSVAAVGLSTTLLIVVSSLFTGFIEAFEQSAVDIMGDVIVAPPIRFAKYPQFIKELQQTSAVQAATATLNGQGLLFLGKGNIRGVTVLGIEPEGRASVTGFKNALRKQKTASALPTFNTQTSEDKTGGFVGIGVLATPDEKTDEYDYNAVDDMIGKQVVLITAASQKLKRKNIPFTITDVVFSGVYELDKTFIYLPIEKMQTALFPDESGQIATQIQIKLDADVSIESALAQIRGVWSSFAEQQLGWSPYLIKETIITTSRQMQSQQIAEFRKQMGILMLIFGIISCSVILLILCILYMIVETKLKDIAIIKSCGAADMSAALIFIGFGACVGVIGSGLGMIFGYLITRNINVIEGWIRVIFGLKLWKSSVYMFSKIPNQMDWNSVLPIVLWSIAAAVIGALIPAVVAIRTKPVHILRYE